MKTKLIPLPCVAGILGLLTFSNSPVFAQPAPAGGSQFTPSGGLPPAAQPADAAATPPPMDDRTHMMGLLGITALRSGASGTNGLPNSANYDESKATAKTPIPDVLKFNDGTPVKTAADWTKRRAEIVELFDREMYGRVPANVPKVNWEVTNTANGMNGTYPIVTKTVVGHVDNSSYPAVSVNIQLTVTTPANASGPVPVMMIFSAGGPGGLGGARGAAPGGVRGAAPAAGARGSPGARGGPPPAPNAAEMAQINAALRSLIAGADPDSKNVFDKYASYNPIPIPGGPAGLGAPRAGAPAAGGPRGGVNGSDPSYQLQLLAKGWGYASLSTGSIQADNGAGLTAGIIGLVNKGDFRKPDDWGVLRAWAWGASRALDYLETDKDVNAKQVGLEGHSRWGKSTIVAMAYDTRFAIAYVSSSGEGGAKIWRHLMGEEVGNIAGTSEYHWMAGNFLKYDGPQTVDDLPIDAHELVAMCAPRPVFVSGGANGDAWQDPVGMFMAAAYASPVYELLGKKGMGTLQMPAMNVPLIDGDVAYREHDQGHFDWPNWSTFLTFASKYITAPPAKTASASAAANGGVAAQ